MWPFPKPITAEKYEPSIVFPKENLLVNLTEEFKGEVEVKTIKFPKELGEVHPFDFTVLEGLYKKFGFFTAVVDKYIDYVIGPGFYIECEDDRAKKIIEDFITDVNLDTLLRAWVKEGLVKGNGFIEIGGDSEKGIEGVKILNANHMYVVRDKKGKIEGYNQYKGGFDRFAKDKIISFKPHEIAHFAFNKIGDCAYGLGIGYPATIDMNNLIQNEKDSHFIMKRKANAPIHAQIGYVDGQTKIIPKKEDVESMGKKLENISNKTEWATDILTNFKVVDFGNVGEKANTILEHDVNKLIYDFQIPAVLLGMANINEGIAKVQMDGFQRRIQSIQAEVEKIVEQQLFKRVLEANGFDVHVEFEWGTPSTLEVEGRMSLIGEIIKSPTTSFAMKSLLEDELVNLLKLDEKKWEELKTEEEEEKERELERPQPIVPGQNQNTPQPTVPKKEQPKQPKPQAKGDIKLKETVRYETQKQCPHCTEGWDNINDVEEWLGFNYKKYLKSILKVVKFDEFVNLLAANDIEEQAGYLSGVQVGKLKNVLHDGFKKGSGMKEIAKQIDKKVGVKDLYKMENGKLKIGASGLPILQRTAEKRSIGITRTEITRLANKGAIEQYKENNINKIRWVASYGERTCPICEELNNQIFDINKVPPLPAHVMCRCTVAPVVELV